MQHAADFRKVNDGKIRICRWPQGYSADGTLCPKVQGEWNVANH